MPAGIFATINATDVRVQATVLDRNGASADAVVSLPIESENEHIAQTVVAQLIDKGLKDIYASLGIDSSILEA